MTSLPRRLVRLLLASACITGAQLAQAHSLICQCEELPEQEVRCKGGFAHGSGAPGVPVDVIGNDEQVLLSGRFGNDSTFTFKRPEGDFYVLMDVGPGHTLEVTSSQIRPMK